MNEPIMQFFEYEHLPSHLQRISKPFCDLARSIVAEDGMYDDPADPKTERLHLPRNAERTVALRKLLESKDAAVRAALAKAPG